MKFLIFLFLLLPIYVYADDYVITSFGGGQVIIIEHNGIISAFGQGEPDKDKAENNLVNYFNINKETDLEAAQRNEANGQWYYALRYYYAAGEIEKMEEMAYKEIEITVVAGDYDSASNTALKYLEDKDLALEYYEKHVDQKLNMEVQ